MTLNKLHIGLLALIVFLMAFLLSSSLIRDPGSLGPSISIDELQRIHQLSKEVTRFLEYPGPEKDSGIQKILDKTDEYAYLSYLDWSLKLSSTRDQKSLPADNKFFEYLGNQAFKVSVPVGKERVKGVLVATGTLVPSFESNEGFIARLLISLAFAGFAVCLILWFKARDAIKPVDKLCQEFTRYRREHENTDLQIPFQTHWQTPIERRVTILQDLWGRFQLTQEELASKVQELEQSKAALERTIDDLEKAKAQERRLVELGYALAEFGHDIRNANGAILAFVSLISKIFEKEPLSMMDIARCPMYAKNIKIASEMITGLTTDILEFSKGKTEIRNETVAFEDLKGKLEVNFGFAEDVPIEYDSRGIQGYDLFVDSNKLIRVVVNLVKNSWEKLCNEEGDGKILIRFSGDTKKGLTVLVFDSGSPIPQEILPRLFQSFSTRGKEKGTGLGLAICKKIIEAHGGKIAAKNLPNEAGVQFSFYLPQSLIPKKEKHSQKKLPAMA